MIKKSVVIVDDAIYMRIYLKKIILSDGRFEIIGEGANGFEALEQAKKEPDVMTLDITMPEMDGITALPKIKERSPNTSIIMVSAMAKRSLIIRAIKEGADEFIMKPFENDKVIETLSKLIIRQDRHRKENV